MDTVHVDRLAADLSVCGRFQVVLTLVTYVIKMSATWSMIMMAFGSYNPGWTCSVDGTVSANRTTFSTLSPESRINGRLFDVITPDSNLWSVNDSSTYHIPVAGTEEISPQRGLNNSTYDTCEYLPLCENKITFISHSRTVVTEWNLICDRAWILSLITSIQMVGVAIGSYACGYLGDRFGRKLIMYCAVALGVVSNGVAYFAPSWEMFAAVRFVIGVSTGGNLGISQIYPLEFVNQKWRPVVNGFPTWHIGLVLFGVCVMLVRDWRYLQLATSALCLLALLTAVWVPESFRWLLVHRKTKKAKRVITQVCLFNGIKVPDIESDIAASEDASKCSKGNTKTRSSVSMLFHSTLRKKTILTTLLFGLSNAMFYTLSFAVKSLYGDFYLNFILSSLGPIPLFFLVPLLGNKFGRRWALLTFFILSFFSFVAVVIVFFTTSGSVRGIFITCLAIFVANWLQCVLSTLNTFSAELFPTVIRYLAFGFVSTGARVGSILAPFVIPRDFDTLYISYLAMSLMALICCVSIWYLPETKDVALEDLVGDNKRAELSTEKQISTSCSITEELDV